MVGDVVRLARRRVHPFCLLTFHYGTQAVHAGLLDVVAAKTAFAESDAWLDANRTLLGHLLSEQLPEVAWTPQASYLAWLDCSALSLGDDPAAAFLERGRLALAPGTDYGRSGAGYAWLNFGTSAELVADMVQRMADTAPHRQAR